MQDIQHFDKIMIGLASPNQIREWSYGEVKKPETINYRTLRPEKDGLFCERIFGTTKEWECYCGKFKSIRYKGVICDRCGVEVTHFRVRRERMGHIELAAPVSHIWYYRSVPSRIALLLDMSMSTLRSILYYEKYIVINPGETELKRMEVLTEEQYEEMRERYGVTFTAELGAEAIRPLLEDIDLKKLSQELRETMAAKGSKADKRLLKRVEIIENFRDSQNKPEWMVMDVIPVIPPELRPMVQLEGGRFATSDLNDLYRRVINRNNRLRRLMTLNAPDIIIRNEKRMLQEAVDALFDNSKKRRVVKGPSNRPLKSLSDMLKGKQGRFRQNLLGKRVDYSGRSVIVVGPELQLHQCGLPTKMALELFKPFIMKKLVEKDVVYNVRKAKTLVEEEAPEVWAILEEIVREHPVILNRAPTLHRLGMQAFEPVLVSGKAIRLHPLVCHAFNADFDGDQMAVHVPLTHEAQTECWSLMLSSRNLLNPANGKPIVFPSLDIVLGITYLTTARPGARNEGKRFGSFDEVIMALDSDVVEYSSLVKIRTENGWLETTPGRVILNQSLPKQIEFINQALRDVELRDLVAKTFSKLGSMVTVELLDAIKELGFRYATIFGATISMDDIVVPSAKKEMIEKANKETEVIQRQYQDGHMTNEERYNRTVEVWNRTNEELTNIMMKGLEEDRGGFNPVYFMVNSGARGSRSQIRQLAGMRGLMAKPSGDIIELPIRSNFKEGLSVIEFFISTNGARKGLADTALKTADAGYLTRRLVDIAQDVVVNEDDCNTINGIEMSALKDGEEIVESLADRIRGRFTLERVRHPITGEMLVDVNEEVTDELADRIEEVGIESVRIRTVLTCETKYGVCRKCYGRNLSNNRPVNIGEAVGIIAAQSIGQPGTQLTMRTFHIGGAATKASEESRTYLRYPVSVRECIGDSVTLENGNRLFTRKGYAIIARLIERFDLRSNYEAVVHDGDKVFRNQVILEGKKKKIQAKDNAYIMMRDTEMLLVAQDQRLEIRNGAELLVKEGDIVPADASIATFDPFSEPIISEQSGVVLLKDIEQGTTLKEEINEDTGNVEKKITEYALETLQPRIVIADDTGTELATYYLPGAAYLEVEEGQNIEAGHRLAKMLRLQSKTGDITGGLPRVGELFEARRPKESAVLAQIAGVVHFRPVNRGKRIIVVEDFFGKEYQHQIVLGRHILVRDSDHVEAGDRLCEGGVDPHELLHILGENALQRFLVNEVQEVYRLQGVEINDKHIGVIIRQMLRKIEILHVGDTRFIIGQQIDKHHLREENRRVMREGGQPAIARPLLLGITRAALNIDSFISAASFQETARVLTNASIAGATDELRGLKENVIIGHLIPAGTGIRRYGNIRLFDEHREDLDLHMQQILEQRKREREEAEALQAVQDSRVPAELRQDQEAIEAGLDEESIETEEESSPVEV